MHPHHSCPHFLSATTECPNESDAFSGSCLFEQDTSSKTFRFAYLEACRPSCATNPLLQDSQPILSVHCTQRDRHSIDTPATWGSTQIPGFKDASWIAIETRQWFWKLLSQKVIGHLWLYFICQCRSHEQRCALLLRAKVKEGKYSNMLLCVGNEAFLYHGLMLRSELNLQESAVLSTTRLRRLKPGSID